ncbi:MAG: deoxyribonuclease IV [Nitrospirae bacterium]|nr:deoxyribonuclease IV [Nitrospirota bacterium]
MLLGAHMSIAGGIDKAIERGISLSCTTIQLFTKNSNQWKGKTLKADEVDRFIALRKKSGISPIIAHDSYLINLASGNHELRESSIKALTGEMERCRKLEIQYIVMHPGAHLGTGEDIGINNIVSSLNFILKETDGWGIDIVLESTAGQGTSIGYRLEHLGRIIAGVEEKERIKVCLDTCHLFAAGYDISTPEGYEKVLKEFDRIVGIDRLVCIHLNDSKKGLGSHVDRHEHIGKGCIGKGVFKLLMKDKRFDAIPKIIETPKGEDMKEDRINLALLRKMAGQPSS